MGLLSTIQSVLSPYTPVDRTKVFGTDTSHWSGVVDFNIAKATGMSFTIGKAMDGVTQTKFFVENYEGAKKAGVPTGMYSWLYKNTVLSTAAQARAFADLYKRYPTELPPTIDFEWTASGNPTAAVDLYDFLVRFEEYTGKKAMIYTAWGYWNQYGSTNAFYAKYPLWVAQYKVSQPNSFAPWNNAYKLFQFTDRAEAKLYGYPTTGESGCDMNYFGGTKEEFNAWIGGTIVTPPDPTPIPDPIIPPVVITSGEFQYGIPRYVNLGPAIIAGSDAPKANHPTIALDASKQTYIKALSNNRADVWKIFSAVDVGPSKGINSNGKLIYIVAGWSGNVVKVIGKAPGWIKVESIRLDKPLPPVTEVNHLKTPHLVHRMTTVNKYNQFITYPPVSSTVASPWDSLDDPLLSEAGEFWLPADWFTNKLTTKYSLNIRSGVGTSFPVVGGLGVNSTVSIIDIKTDASNNVWGCLSADKWICLKLGKTNHTTWILA